MGTVHTLASLSIGIGCCRRAMERSIWHYSRIGNVHKLRELVLDESEVAVDEPDDDGTTALMVSF